MFVLGLLVGATLSLVLYGALNAAATSDSDSEIATLREKYQKALETIDTLQDKIKNIKRKLKYARMKLTGIGGYSDGRTEEQKERIPSGKRSG